MQALRLSVVVLSLLVFAAHLVRAGWPLAVAAFAPLLPVVLVGGRRSAVRGVQIVLGIALVEWLRTLAQLVAARRAAGLASVRLMLVLGTVAAVTAAAIAAVEIWRRHRSVGGRVAP